MSDNLSDRENTMMRLTRTHRSLVSNRLAVLAAFILFAAAAAGYQGATTGSVDAGPALAASQSAPADNAARASSLKPATANKRFKVRFYLFRHR